MTDELVYVYTPESKVHVAVKHDGNLLSSERCNLDDIHGERTVDTSMPVDRDAESLCRRCFPQPGDLTAHE